MILKHEENETNFEKMNGLVKQKCYD